MRPPKNRVIEEGYNIINKDISPEKRDKLFLEYYEKNLSFFDNIDSVSGNKLISDIISMKIIYIRILDDTDKKSKQKEARPICDHLFILLQRMDPQHYEYERLYNLSLFWDGVIWGRLGKYRKSNKRFRELLKRGETTEKNKGWYVYNLASIWNWFIIPAVIILTILSFWKYIPLLLGIELPRMYPILSYSISLCLLLIFSIYFTNKKIFKYIIDKKYK